MALTELTYDQLAEQIPDVLKAGLVPFVQGNPGIGKSTFWREIAFKFDLAFIDIRLSTYDPTMLNGFLWVDNDEKKATFLHIDDLPIEGDTPPINPKTGEPFKGYLIHFDEFTHMPKAVEGAAFRIVLDRQVSTNRFLHPKALLACSGNPQGMGMISKSISTPMRSRLVHFAMKNETQKFIHNAIDKLDFHPLIPAFLKANPSDMNNFIEQCSNIDGTYACERTWEMLSKLVKVKTANGRKIEDKDLPSIIGTVGEESGGRFMGFVKSYYSCPDISTIVANPDSATVPELEVDQYAALPYLVYNVSLNNGEQVAKYVKRYNQEFQLIFGKMLVKKNEEIFDKHFEFLTDLVVQYALAS